MTGSPLASPPVRLALIAGVALGFAYATSPMLVWFLIAAAALFAWAGRGLSARERRVVWAVLAIAIAIRLLAVAYLFLTSDPHHVGNFAWEGDGPYFKLRSLWRRNVWIGVPLPPRYFQNAFDLFGGYGWSTLVYLAAFLQYLFGPAPYGLHLVNVLAFLTAAVVLYRLARGSFGPEAALLGLALVVLTPTLFAWSISALKEPPVTLLMAVMVASIVGIARAPRLRSRAAAVVLLVAAAAVIDGIKPGALILAAGGVAVGLAATALARRPRLVLLVPVMALAVAWAVATRPDVQDRVMAQVRRGAGLHIGHVRTPGFGYKLLDQRFYSADKSGAVFETMTPEEALRFTIRALGSVVLFPLPTQMQSRAQLAYLPQQMLWYFLLVLTVVGLVAGLRRDALVTCLLAGLVLVGGAAVALNSGNLGTMVRHRDLVVPFMLWLSALGAVATVSAWFARRQLRGREAWNAD